jgi:hypothetical protein
MKIITGKALILGSILTAVTKWIIQAIEMPVSIMPSNHLKRKMESSRV